MEWLKYPLDKLMYFIASIIPGFTALIAFHLCAPGQFEWFFGIGVLGYKTKLAVILFAAFVIGYSVTTLTRALIGGVRGAIVGAFRSVFQPYASHSVAPWRDPKWRAALKSYLGESAPPDTQLISGELYKLRSQMVDLLPQPQRAQALSDLNNERIRSEMNDASWAGWYDHFHEIVIKPADKDWWFHLRFGLNINFESAALVVLIGSIFIPTFRHWWLVLPSILWVLQFVAEEYSAYERNNNRWSSLSLQITHLLESQAAPQAIEKAVSATNGYSG